MVQNLKDINRENLLDFCLDNSFNNLQDMGDYFGVSKQRVDQILKPKGMVKIFEHIKNYEKYKKSLNENMSYVTDDIWKPFSIESKYFYEISDKGEVRQIITKQYGIFEHSYTKRRNPCITSTNKKQEGYLGFDVVQEGKRVRYTIHRLVAEAFIPNPDNLPCVNHIDGDPHNNDRYNLEWCTYKDNTRHYWDYVHENSENKRYNYDITTPDGEIITVHNLRKWCRDFNFLYESFQQCLAGKSQTCCGGYTISRKH